MYCLSSIVCIALAVSVRAQYIPLEDYDKYHGTGEMTTCDSKQPVSYGGKMVPKLSYRNKENKVFEVHNKTTNKFKEYQIPVSVCGLKAPFLTPIDEVINECCFDEGWKMYICRFCWRGKCKGDCDQYKPDKFDQDHEIVVKRYKKKLPKNKQKLKGAKLIDAVQELVEKEAYGFNSPSPYQTVPLSKKQYNAMKKKLGKHTVQKFEL